MSIRQSLLAILGQGPCYGYQLRTEFIRRTGETWLLNVGQVYNTLERLERDGLVAKDKTDNEQQVTYRITDSGRQEVSEWLSSAVPRSTATRDELAMKLVVAATLPGAEIARIIEVQRKATLIALQNLRATRKLNNEPVTTEGLVYKLVTDSLVFAAEAELSWLDHCETELKQAFAAGYIPMALSESVPKRGRPTKKLQRENETILDSLT